MNKNLPNQKGSFQVNHWGMRGISMLLVLLVGFDDIPLAQFAYPPLSSVSRQSRKIGEETALLFLAKVNGLVENKQISLKPQLIIRDSSRKRTF